MNKENCALKLVDEITLYYDARSKNIKNSIKMSPVNQIQSLHTPIQCTFSEKLLNWCRRLTDIYVYWLRRLHHNSAYDTSKLCVL